MVELKEMIIKKGVAARPGYALKPEYITIHNTANRNSNANALSHGKYLNGAGGNTTTSYHYVVDDIMIVRLIPDTEVAWHAGDGANGTGNRKSLAIEICENPECNLLKATDNAAELTAALMHDYNIPIGRVVQHNYWSGKDCPNRIRKGEPYTWNVFLDKVKSFYDVRKAPTTNSTADSRDTLYTVQTGAFKSKENAENYAKELKDKGIQSIVKEKK